MHATNGATREATADLVAAAADAHHASNPQRNGRLAIAEMLIRNN